MKQRSGCLVKRGCSYSVRMVIDGQVIVRALRTPEDTPCKTLQDARKAQANATREFALLHRKEALQVAIRKLSETEAELLAINHPKVAIADAWEAYIRSGERPNSGAGTLDNYRRHITQFHAWQKAHYPKAVNLCDVSKTMASEYGRHLADTYSPNTHNKNIIFLRLLWRVLCDGDTSPFSKIKTKPLDTTPHQALSTSQLQAILGRADGELKTLLLVGIYGGALRRKDACLLKWSQVDMDKGTITVMPAKTASRSSKVVSIPLHPVLQERLKSTFRTSEYVMPNLSALYQHDASAIAKKLNALFEDSGIQRQQEVEKPKGSKRHNKAVFSFHSLRHTMGQILLSNNFGLDTIAAILGHTSTQTTKIYASASDAVKRQAILSLPSITSATA